MTGVKLKCESNPSLNAVYPTDSRARALIASLYAGLKDGAGFPEGGPTIALTDVEGNPHDFTAKTFRVFAGAFRDHLEGLSEIIEIA